MKYFFITLSFLALGTTSFAQVPEDGEQSKDLDSCIITYADISLPDSIVDLPECFNYDIDSLLSQWYASNHVIYDSDCIEGSINPIFSDSVYAERLSSLPTVIEMPYNYYTKNAIDAYMQHSRKVLAYAIGMFPVYDNIFTNALLKYNLPIELRYLPIVESALRPRAYSKMGAAGMWQFIYGTGKNYGLTVNSLIDDRYDVIKETDAAARHLRDLYEIFGDWNLAISAYNCGPGNVTKAITRSGGKKTFWEIYPYLPRETRGYLPAFIAVNYAMSFYKEHGICPMEPIVSQTTDTIHITKNTHFEQIIHFTGISKEELQNLNPQYLTDVIPGSYKTCSLTVPSDCIRPLLEAGDSLYLYRNESYFTKSKLDNIDDGMKNRPTYVTHKIRSGETLSTIAQKYHTTVKNIKKWNNLTSDRIKAGKSLRIYNR
jgi:membrane-bound lytic murein transglycosylase D